MVEAVRCAKCGNVVSGDLGGRCPECMLQAGLDGSSLGMTGPATVDYRTAGVGGVAAAAPGAGEDFGGYHLVRALGQGGMGTVFEAEERATGRRLALKVLRHSLESAEARQRFYREGRLAAAVNHPHSVYIFCTDEVDSAPVIAMELVHGGTLQDRVRRHGPMPSADAVDAILQVIDGLDAAQAVGVLHRDVKPSNCFVDSDGQVKIGDFGLSISKEARGDLHITSSGVILGTPAFASPEQLRGDELDHRSDQYAVGVSLFYLLTGKVPFDAEQMIHLIATVLEKPAPDVRSLRADVPRDLALILERCLEKEPARRFRGYADLRAALLPFSSLVPTPATPAWRVSAGLTDAALLMLLFKVQGAAMVLVGMPPTLSPTLARKSFDIGMSVLIWFLYYVVPEGWWGATLGKRLFQIRVVRRETMRPPGLVRASIRSAIYKVLPSLPLWLYTWQGPSVVDADGQLLDLSDLKIVTMLVMGLTALPLWALLFVTMRRGNGYAAIHDLCSGTRLIFKPWTPARPMLTLASLAADAVQTGPTQVGPYHLLSGLGANEAGDWHLGYDTRLLRKVWVRLVPSGTPPVSAALRNQARAGRLRWLTGRRGPDENWDAFEAPTGQPLWTLLDEPRDWHEVRYWLLDLSEELGAGLKDDTLPEQLGLDHVWITAEGRAKLFDLPLPGLPDSRPAPVTTIPGEVGLLRGFLRQVTASALRGRRCSPVEAELETFALPLPLHARPIVDGLGKIQRPEVLSAEIQCHLSRPARLTPARRWTLLATCIVLPVVLMLLSLGGHYFSMMTALAQYPELVVLKDTLYRHTPPFNLGTQPSAEETAALETYIAGRFAERINDPDFWQNSYVVEKILPSHRKIAKEIVARTPPPTKEELAKAARIAFPEGDPYTEIWEGDEAETHEKAPVWALAVIVFGIYLVLLVALPSILGAMIFGGGLLWRLFGVAAVTRDGRLASRWRLTWRQLLAWAPILVFPAGLFTPWAEDAFFWGPIVAVALTAFLGSTFFSKRSWPDRLAGTWLVMR